MADISAALVKQLRDKTGAGMMDCKKALTETGGEVEAAVDWLRKKGLAAAAKRAGRVASEGLVSVCASDGKAAVVEVNSETDFVARNETFQEVVRTIAGLALEAGGDMDTLAAAAYPGNGAVSEKINELVGTIGENIQLRRTAALSAAEGVVATYVHGAIKPGLGRIGVLLSLESPGDKSMLAEFGKQIAMHVAASRPESLSIDDVDPATIDRERSVLAEQARASGKPEEVIEKMVEGRIRKFYEETVLLEQAFVIDGKTKISKVLEQAAAEVGGPVRIGGFVRMALGEGIASE